MPVVLEDGGVPPGDGGGGALGKAAYTFLHGEPTVYAFSPDDLENAVRNTYIADTTQTPFAVVFVRPELIEPFAFDDVAATWAWIWDQNARVPGVVDIAPDQSITALGRLLETVQVALESTSGRSEAILNLEDQYVMPVPFAERVRAEVARMDAIEAAG